MKIYRLEGFFFCFAIFHVQFGDVWGNIEKSRSGFLGKVYKFDHVISLLDYCLMISTQDFLDLKIC